MDRHRILVCHRIFSPALGFSPPIFFSIGITSIKHFYNTLVKPDFNFFRITKLNLFADINYEEVRLLHLLLRT